MIGWKGNTGMLDVPDWLDVALCAKGQLAYVNEAS